MARSGLLASLLLIFSCSFLDAILVTNEDKNVTGIILPLIQSFVAIKLQTQDLIDKVDNILVSNKYQNHKTELKSSLEIAHASCLFYLDAAKTLHEFEIENDALTIGTLRNFINNWQAHREAVETSINRLIKISQPKQAQPKMKRSKSFIKKLHRAKSSYF